MGTHSSTRHFDQFISMLQDERPGFSLVLLAEQLGCTTERIRKLRSGVYDSINANDIEVLYDQYNASMEYLVKGIGPMQRTALADSAVGYQRIMDEITLLKRVVLEKDHQVTVYEAAPPATPKKKKGK